MKSRIVLLKTTTLTSFPSGSSINYHSGKLYLVGDDANHLLVLDTSHRQTSALRLFNYKTKRIPKDKKPDLETSALVPFNKQLFWLILGSASAELRKKAYLLPLINGHPQLKQLTRPSFYNATLLSELSVLGIKEINIEGATLIGNNFVISNRGNLSHKTNHLIVLNKDFIRDQSSLTVFATELKLNNFIGVSELCYEASNDRLLIAFSSEATANAYDDGVIGDSFIGWIDDVSKKLLQSALVLDELVNLAEVNKAFVQQKIEGICVEAVQGDSLVMHLVADDDKGNSRLFKIRLDIPTKK